MRRIYIIGCGSAYHVGVAARYVFESLARLPVEVDVASEFRYRDPVLEPDSMAVIISQSGETADTLVALRECGERGVRTIGIVNVVGSSIAREADATPVHLGRAGNCRCHHQGIQHPTGGLLPAGGRICPCARQD